ncbi:MAG: hypothetical protein AAGG02_09180 [Cyanobacteria bacterium P01_H01_bin.15]
MAANAANALTFSLFNDRATWQAAIGGPTSTEDFNSFVSDTVFSGTSIAAGDLTLIGNDVPGPFDTSSRIAVDPGFGGNFEDGTPAVAGDGLEFGESIVVQLPGTFSAFGFDALNYDSDLQGLDVFVGSDLVTSFPASFSGNFIGFIASDGSFDQVEFRSSSQGSSITEEFTFNSFDNVEWGGANTVTPPTPTTPEPAAVLGFVGVSLLSQRLRKKK